MDIYTTITANITVDWPWENYTNSENYTMNLENADDKATVSRAAFIVPEVVAIFCAVFGLAGNLLTVLTIMNTPKLKQNVNNAFVCSLSVADAFYCGLILPWQAVILHVGHRIWTETFCAWLAALIYAIFGTTFLSLCAIALNRYIHVCYPHYSTRIYTRFKIVAMLVVSWCFPLIVTIMGVVGIWGEYGYQERTRSCTFGKLENANTNSYRIFVYASGLGIPIVFMAFCYSRIGLTFYRSRKKVKQSSRTQLHSGRQLTISMLIIFVVFVLCIGPFAIVDIVDHQMKCKECHLITPMFSWIQITLNPIIYTITNSQFRKAYKSILRRMFSCYHCPCCRPCQRCLLCSHCRFGRSSSTSNTTSSSQVNIVNQETSTRQTDDLR